MLVLDTHVLIWWINGDKMLSRAAAKAIRDNRAAAREIVISSISVWEICMLIRKGRLVLRMDLERWLTHVADIEGLRFMPVDNELCLLATALPGTFHKDPADRMIVAAARKLAAPLVTADDKIMAYGHVSTIW